MPKKIRDTIHGYIYLTRLEEAVSQHPLVLRMHYIHQTSFTYLTYPNAHSTRYPHSLGVMHVAGELFQSALANSDPDTLTDISFRVASFLGPAHLRKIHTEFSKSQAGWIKESLYEKLVWGGDQRAVGNAKLSVIEDASTFYLPLILLFQATRLAAMLHDIGHPPFSHIVEYALLQACPPPIYLGHEKVGYALLDLVIKDGTLEKRSACAFAPLFSTACLDLCKEILKGEENTSTFFGLKSTLLSGPIDADRLDYVRRDAYSSGMVPTYDIRRMVDAAFFRLSPDGKHFEIAYKPNCLSSFENFFSARYDLYRYMIFHHDVARRNLSVQKLIVSILTDETTLPAKVTSLGKDFFDVATGKAAAGYAAYESFNDATLLNLLWNIDAEIRDVEGGASQATLDAKLFLDVVLRRRNDYLRTLLKRPNDYARFARQVMERVTGQGIAEGSPSDAVAGLNERLRDKLVQIKNEERVDENIAKFRLGKKLEAFMDAKAREKLPKGDIRFHCYYAGTFNAGPRREVEFSEPGDGNDARTVAEDISPTIAMLEKAWQFSPQLTVFFHSPGERTSAKAQTLRRSLESYAVDGMVEYLEAP